MKNDLIRRQDAKDAVDMALDTIDHVPEWVYDILLNSLDKVPSAEPRKKGKWTTEEVAEILFNAFGNDCACNFNGIDEWLPERCKYTEIADECPEPKEKHGCWMQFLLQGGADMRGEEDG